MTVEIGIATIGEATDVTAPIREFCHGLGDGLLNVFAPHSTVGLALVQVGEGSGEDLVAALHRLAPRDAEYTHREKSPGHGADHLIPLLCAPTLTIPVVDGIPLLGEFQQVVFLDTDRDPSARRLRLTFLNDRPPG